MGSRRSTSTIARTTDVIDTTRDSAVPSVCLITMGWRKNEDSAASGAALARSRLLPEEASSADAIIVNTACSSRRPPRRASMPSSRPPPCPKWMRAQPPHRRRLHAGPLRDDLPRELTEASALCPAVARTISRKRWRALWGISSPVAVVEASHGKRRQDVRLREDIRRLRPLLRLLHHPPSAGATTASPYEQIAEDVEREIASGAQEIVLIAQTPDAGAPTFPTAATSHGSSTRWPRRTPTRGSARHVPAARRAQPDSCSPLWRPARTFALI